MRTYAVLAATMTLAAVAQGYAGETGPAQGKADEAARPAVRPGPLSPVRRPPAAAVAVRLVLDKLTARKLVDRATLAFDDDEDELYVVVVENGAETRKPSGLAAWPSRRPIGPVELWAGPLAVGDRREVLVRFYDQVSELRILDRPDNLLGSVRVVLFNDSGEMRVDWQPIESASEPPPNRKGARPGDAPPRGGPGRRLILTGCGGRYEAALNVINPDVVLGSAGSRTPGAGSPRPPLR